MPTYSSATNKEPSRLQRLAENKWLDRLVLCAILVNSIILAINPNDDVGRLSFFYVSDKVLIAIF